MDYIKLKLKDKSAQDMVEFTFVLPLLMFCFVMILTGGQLVYNKFVAYNACFNGIRQACTESSYRNAKKAMKNKVEQYYDQAISLDVDNCEIKILNADGTNFTDGHSWIKNEEIVGHIVFHVKTLFPINFSDLKAANIMYVSGVSAAYIEYDYSNGRYATDGSVD